MTAKLTADQISAMNALPPGVPLELVDETEQRSYILFDKDAYEAWVDQKLQEAEASIERGETEAWDVKKMEELCRQRTNHRANV